MGEEREHFSPLLIRRNIMDKKYEQLKDILLSFFFFFFILVQYRKKKIL